MDIEQQFLEMWNSGVRAVDIMNKLNCDENYLTYLKKVTHAAPRRNRDVSRQKSNRVWDMVTRRVPVEEIMKKESVKLPYIQNIIYKHGHTMKDFYVRRRKLEDIEPPKNGVRCTPCVMHKCIYGTSNCCMYLDIMKHRRPCPSSDCTCFKQRPKNFKQKSYEGREE